MTTSIHDFEASETPIGGLWVLHAKAVTDERGTISEIFRASAFVQAGIPDIGPWTQVNLTETQRGAIRGMHGEPTVKLVGVVTGEAFGAYVDPRPDSPTCGRVVTVALTKGVQVLVPSGVCNGWQALSEEPVQYLYCFTNEWQPGMDGAAIHPLDPELAIDWPIAIDPRDPAMLSAKDAQLPTLQATLDRSSRR